MAIENFLSEEERKTASENATVRIMSGTDFSQNPISQTTHDSVIHTVETVLRKLEPEELSSEDMEMLVEKLFAKNKTVIDFEEPRIKGSLHLLTKGETLENNKQTPTRTVGYKINVRFWHNPEEPTDYSREIHFSEDGQNPAQSSKWHDALYLSKIPSEDAVVLGKFDDKFVAKLIIKQLLDPKQTIH